MILINITNTQFFLHSLFPSFVRSFIHSRRPFFFLQFSSFHPSLTISSIHACMHARVHSSLHTGTHLSVRSLVHLIDQSFIHSFFCSSLINIRKIEDHTIPPSSPCRQQRQKTTIRHNVTVELSWNGSLMNVTDCHYSPCVRGLPDITKEKKNRMKISESYSFCFTINFS